MESAGNFVSVATISRGPGENHITAMLCSAGLDGIFGELCRVYAYKFHFVKFREKSFSTSRS